MEIKYPSVDDVINANRKAIELLRATKAERHEVLAPKYRIEEVMRWLDE